MGRPAKPLDRIKLYDHYTFDPTIPQLLRVKTPYGQSKRTTGEPVSFYVHQNGYASVSVLGKSYRRSRVIYSLCKGHIPEGMFVDHIDGNRLNDHPDNLRLVTPQQNQWNKDNPGGKLQNYLPKGIDFVKAEGRYRARIKIDGKVRARLSYEVRELMVWLQEQRQKLHGEYAYDGWTNWTEADQKRADERYEVSKPEGYKPRKRRLPGYAKTHDGLKVYIEPKTGRLYFKKLNKKHYIDEESVVV